MGASLKYEDITASLRAIVQPESVFELRLLGSRKRQVSAGYFNSIDAAATALCGLQEPYQGVYLTPNPVDPELLARAANRIKPGVEWGTTDDYILRRLWLLIDIDPKRPSDVSSTDAEHQRALFKAREIAGMLDVEYGWCDPMMSSSGNGAHLMYPINEPNDKYTTDTIKLFLQCLAHRFNGMGCTIDTSVFNPARIWRLPGTLSRKGDSTPERPHRKAAILAYADDFGVVTIEQVEEYIAENPLPPKEGKSKQKAELESERIYTKLNSKAMKRIGEWVPHFFPGAYNYKDGYRVPSAELDRDREEDLSIQPYPIGITDFGEHDMGDKRGGKRSPVSLIAEFLTDMDIHVAARQLATLLDTELHEFGELPADAEHKVEKALKADYDPFTAGERTEFDLSLIKPYPTLQNKQFKELQWIIPKVLPVGCFILAARPKMRKTWLALQLCLAAATGSKFLDWQVEQCDTLFLGLEDNERRIKSRVETLHTFEFELPDLKGFNYFTEGTFPRGDEGVDVLRQYHDVNPNCRLMVIDTFAHFRKMSRERDIYLKDYQAVMPITRFAAERQVCVIVVHHEKKGLANQPTGDFLEDVNGSSGITGGVDGVISIKGKRGPGQEGETRNLLITGRDVPFDYNLDMSFDAERGGWLMAARQDAKLLLRQLFERNPFMARGEITAFLPNIPRSTLDRALVEMRYEQVIEQTKHGYTLKRNY